MSVKLILQKHGAQRDNYYSINDNPVAEAKKYIKSIWNSYEGNEFPPPSYLFDTPEYRYLKSKWSTKVIRDAIGFSMPQPTPVVWYAILDDFFSYINDENPNFVIKSVIVKHGGISIHLDNISEKVKQEIEELEWELYDIRLIK